MSLISNNWPLIYDTTIIYANGGRGLRIIITFESNRKAMNRHWSNQKANPFQLDYQLSNVPSIQYIC